MEVAAEAPKRKILSMSEIKAGAKKAITYREIPALEPGEFYRVVSLTAGELAEWTEARDGGDPEKKKTSGLRLIVNSLVDDDGIRIGSESDIEFFKGYAAIETEKVIGAILEHNGMSVKKETATKKG